MTAKFADPRFAIEGLIPEGLTFMAGAPKLGKSWLALSLGISVASGGVALGAVDVVAGDVLYLALEDSPRRLQGRLRMLLDDDKAPDCLQLETEWPRLDEGGNDAIESFLVDRPYTRLVIIDVWARLRSRSLNRTDYYSADYDAAAPIQKLAQEHGVAVVVLHHTRKAAAEDFVESVSGTFGTAAAADTIAVVRRSRGEADATLLVTGRDVEEQELALRFSPTVGAWTLLGPAARFRLGETRRKLLEALEAHGNLTPKQASEVTGMRHDLVRQTLIRMDKAGEVLTTKGVYAPIPPVTPVTESLTLVTE
jgi:hypothetical protein